MFFSQMCLYVWIACGLSTDRAVSTTRLTCTVQVRSRAVCRCPGFAPQFSSPSLAPGIVLTAAPPTLPSLARGASRALLQTLPCAGHMSKRAKTDFGTPELPPLKFVPVKRYVFRCLDQSACLPDAGGGRREATVASSNERWRPWDLPWGWATRPSSCGTTRLCLVGETLFWTGGYCGGDDVRDPPERSRLTSNTPEPFL